MLTKGTYEKPRVHLILKGFRLNALPQDLEHNKGVHLHHHTSASCRHPNQHKPQGEEIKSISLGEDLS